MGNNQSSRSESTITPSNQELTKRKKFGSIYDPSNPRPGYYYNKNTRVLKYKIHNIILLQGEYNFVKLKYGYAKTNKRVFYKGIHLTSANQNNFETMNIPEIKKLGIHSLSKYNSVLGVEKVDGTITKVYYKGKLVPGVPGVSFAE